ncbi:MAG: transglutaminase domain-containing protein [Methanocellales archaeon]
MFGKLHIFFLIIFLSLVLIASDNSANSNIQNSTASAVNISLNFKPMLNDYKANKSTEIWSAVDPSEYITPGDEVVQWYAKHTKLKKINESIYLIEYEDGTPLSSNYVRDQEQFGVEDYWIKPSYYLAHTYKGKLLSGDCEDAAIAMTSILLAKGYDTIAILGYVEKNDGSIGRHAWAEAQIEGKIYIVDFNSLYEKNYFQATRHWRPRYMWNHLLSFRDYSSNWNSIDPSLSSESRCSPQ